MAKDRINETYVDQWVTPTYLYNQSHYPLFLSGSCYVMTTLAASCLFEKAMTMQFFHLEDVFITGMVAEQCKIPRINHIGSIIVVKLNKTRIESFASLVRTSLFLCILCCFCSTRVYFDYISSFYLRHS